MAFARFARLPFAVLTAWAALAACGNDAGNAGVAAGTGSSGSAGAIGGANTLGGSAGETSGSASEAGSAGATTCGGSASANGGGGGGGTTVGGQGGSSAGAAGAAGAATGTGGGGPWLGSGTISYERWEGVKGEAVSLVPVSDAPTVTLRLQLFQMPDDVGQDFGARLRGFLTAPVTGDYTFFISCDDNGELSISPDETPANKQRVAYVSGSPAWTDYVEWDKFASQKSAPVPLVAGKRYYVEALLKEDIAEDHLAVGWLKPGELGSLPSEIVPGAQLSPFE